MVVIYVIGAVLALLFLLQLAMVFRARMQQGKEAPRLSGAYGEAASAAGRSLFYFHSPSCAACRPMTPVVKDLTVKHPRVFSIDVTKEMDTARRFGIMGTPSSVIIEGGRIVAFLLGPQSREKLDRMLST